MIGKNKKASNGVRLYRTCIYETECQLMAASCLWAALESGAGGCHERTVRFSLPWKLELSWDIFEIVNRGPDLLALITRQGIDEVV